MQIVTDSNGKLICGRIIICVIFGISLPLFSLFLFHQAIISLCNEVLKAFSKHKWQSSFRLFHSIDSPLTQAFPFWSTIQQASLHLKAWPTVRMEIFLGSTSHTWFSSGQGCCLVPVTSMPE